MKKYLVAGGVAVGAFVFAASAASLNVSADTLQVGESLDGDLTCADAASVVAWSYDNGTADVAEATVALDGNACDGETLYLTLLDDAGAVLDTGQAQLASGTDSYDVTVSAAAEDVENVRIGIVQE